jgi:hypothetical protein
MGIKKVITRSIDALSPKDNSSAHAHTAISEPGKFTSNSFVSNSFGGFAASLDKIYGRVGSVCVESTSKNGFSDGWYQLNPSHGQEGGETADSAFTSGVQGVSCFPGDEGRVGTFTVGSLSAARPSGGQAMGGSSR